MSQQPKSPLDLVRWSFSVNPDRRREIETHLDDLGADVLVRGDCQFVVTWEEPDGDLEDVVEALWDLNGGPFEVTLEEFHRVGLYSLESDGVAAHQEAA
jgi:hypothetical protein